MRFLGGTVSIETVENSTGIPNNHNSIYRRIELADNEQLVTGTKTAYGGRSHLSSARVFDLDLPVDGNLAILNETIGLTLLLEENLFKGTGVAANTINGYNVGDNILKIVVAGARQLQMDVVGNSGGDGIVVD